MRQHNIEALEKFRGHYTTYQQTKTLPYLDDNQKAEILRVVREEFDAGYIANLWCGSCVADLVRYAFVQADKFYASERAVSALNLSTKRKVTK